MKYVAKLHNYPLTWVIDAENETDAETKAWAAIRADMSPEAAHDGGFITVKPETYRQQKERQQKEINEFPLMAAFNEQQFADGMKKLNVDRDGLLSIGAGCFIRKTDRDAFVNMMKRHTDEVKQACAADQTGDGFIYQMFYSCLADHEYSYTGDLSEGIAATPFTLDEINANPALLHGLSKAAAAQTNE